MVKKCPSDNLLYLLSLVGCHTRNLIGNVKLCWFWYFASIVRYIGNHYGTRICLIVRYIGNHSGTYIYLSPPLPADENHIESVKSIYFSQRHINSAKVIQTVGRWNTPDNADIYSIIFHLFSFSEACVFISSMCNNRGKFGFDHVAIIVFCM